jgi:hypothetical protein
VCVKLDASTDELTEAVQDGDITCILEMHWQVPGELPVTFAMIPVRILKPVDSGSEGAPTPATPGYYTAAQVDALIASIIRVEGNRRIVLDADGNYGSEVVT